MPTLRRIALFPSLLCLDAPVVALGWALLLTGSPGAGDAWSRTTLFFAVWSIYLGDRLFDSLRPDKNTSRPPPERLSWAGCHRASITGLLCVASIATAATALRMPVEWWRCGWIPAAATSLYFLVFRGSRIHRKFGRLVPAKELAIGTVFAIGVLLAARGSGGLAFAPGLLASMALLFSGNCLLIARTEAVSDQTHDEAAYFAGKASWRPLPEVFFAAAAVLAPAMDPSFREIGTLAVVGSAGASLAVSRIRRGDVPQALADALLLTPWLLLPWRGGS